MDQADCPRSTVNDTSPGAHADKMIIENRCTILQIRVMDGAGTGDEVYYGDDAPAGRRLLDWPAEARFLTLPVTREIVYRLL